MRKPKGLFLLMAVCCLLCSAPGRTESPVNSARFHIVVIKTRDIPFYAPVVQGFAAGLKSRGYSGKDKVDLKVVALSGKADADAGLITGLLAEKPQLIVTLGTDATRLVADQKPTMPALFSMILDPVALGVVKSMDSPDGDWSGSTLLVSSGKQFDALLQTVPKAKHIGVLYTDKDPTSLSLLADAKQEAVRLNIEINAVAVGENQATKDALNQFKSGTDALWLIPDPASSGPQSLTDTLAFAHAQHLPVLGASSGTVHAGALLALSANLEDLGDVTAEMAVHVLDGTETPAKMHVRGPRRTLLSLNLIVAHDLGLTIPGAVLHLADEVIDTDKEDK